MLARNVCVYPNGMAASSKEATDGVDDVTEGVGVAANRCAWIVWIVLEDLEDLEDLELRRLLVVVPRRVLLSLLSLLVLWPLPTLLSLLLVVG